MMSALRIGKPPEFSFAIVTHRVACRAAHSVVSRIFHSKLPGYALRMERRELAQSALVHGRTIMFDFAAPLAPQKAQPRDASALTAELRQLGFDILPAGSAGRVSVRAVLEGGPASSKKLQALCAVAAAGVPLCLSPVDLGGGGSAIDTWQQFCEAISIQLSRIHDRSVSPGFCISSHQLPLEAFCLIADSVLGKGPRYVFLDSLQMDTHCSRRVEERAAANWTFLWRCRAMSGRVMPVYGGVVKSTCPLLSDEVATAVLPLTGLQVPPGSAWLSIDLTLTRFADSSGRLDEIRLHRALRKAVFVADALLEHQSWSCPLQRQDAVNNRRLAITVSGIGDLVVLRGEDPRNLACLDWLSRVLRDIRDHLCETSVRIAQQDGAVPALGAVHTVGGLPDGPHRDAWCSRFESAVRKAAVRHRNILAISPYAVLPTDRRCDTAFADLLPLIATADAWSFARPHFFTGWNVTQFSNFHRRARAIIQSSQAASFVAAGV